MSIINLNEARILITNDDGIDSQGITKIHAVLEKYSDNIFIVAPRENCSGCGHSITLSRPVRINKVSENIFSCDGTPTDCILLSLQEVLKGKKSVESVRDKYKEMISKDIFLDMTLTYDYDNNFLNDLGKELTYNLTT